MSHANPVKSTNATPPGARAPIGSPLSIPRSMPLNRSLTEPHNSKSMYIMTN